MRTASLSVLLLLIAACGGDDEGSSTAAALCKSQCEKAEECGFLDGTNVNVGECTTSCAKAQSSIKESACMFTDTEIQACKSALADQTCEQVEDSELPDECAKTCS